MLLVDKPAGVTSHDVVARVRRIFGQREVGHTGTLDPMATGLLVLALGRATRLARFIEASEKAYVGTVSLGRSTTTFDAEGELVREVPVGEIDRATLDSVLAGLVGEIQQQVPAFSAIKVDGERLYARARRGEAVEAPTRGVTIHALQLREVRLPELVIETRVSKGTYIRSLAVQIGEGLGLPAHLSSLRRTAVGAHLVDAALRLDELRGVEEELLPLERAVEHLPAIQLDARGEESVRYGRPISAGILRDSRWTAFEAGAECRLLDRAGLLLGIGVAELPSRAVPQAAAGERAVSYACVLAP